jgi:hypothetical protein
MRILQTDCGMSEEAFLPALGGGKKRRPSVQKS